jgi:hypothetical protein
MRVFVFPYQMPVSIGAQEDPVGLLQEEGFLSEGNLWSL